MKAKPFLNLNSNPTDMETKRRLIPFTILEDARILLRVKRAKTKSEAFQLAARDNKQRSAGALAQRYYSFHNDPSYLKQLEKYIKENDVEAELVRRAPKTFKKKTLSDKAERIANLYSIDLEISFDICEEIVTTLDKRSDLEMIKCQRTLAARLAIPLQDIVSMTKYIVNDQRKVVRKTRG